MTEKLNPNTKPQTALSDEELDSVTGGEPTMMADQEVTMPQKSLKEMLENTPPIEQFHTQAQADFAKHFQKRKSTQ